MEKRSVKITEEIINTIKDNMDVDPDMSSSIVKEDGIIVQLIHFNYLMNLAVYPLEDDEDNFFVIEINWYADLKPVLVSELTQALEYIPDGILLVSESFAYSIDNDLIFGDEAETSIAEDHFQMIEEEIDRKKSEDEFLKTRYELGWYKQPSTH